MKFTKLVKRAAILGALVIGVTACSSKPDTKNFSKSANAKQEITGLEMALENSRGSAVDLLAPVSYKEARHSLDEAKEMEKDGKDNEKVLKEVALGQGYLDRAKKNAETNSEKLRDVLAARQAAITAKANTLFPKAFSTHDKLIQEETAKLEDEKDDKVKERTADFITGYMGLELAAIKKIHLGESKFLIDESIKNGARTLTPKSLAGTTKKYKEADLFITQNRHSTSEIVALSAGVLEDARNLESTTATARGLSAATPEETALRMQAEEARLSETQTALAGEQETNMALAASNSNMSKDQKLNGIYEEARTKFSSDEAEVYKQDKKLVIRLRSLEFPKSQAVIKGENFALLKKVEDVIQSFEKSSVVVEGHTDSTGGRQLNQKLSNERAEAVKQYLEANSSDRDTDFNAKGFGYDKPLASNKTAEGRAQNRRVDVIIEPTEI